MQLLITQLPPVITNGDTILRHWLTLDDGRIFFQDELLIQRQEGFELPESRRTEWQQLPSPPKIPSVVGIIDFGGLPLAMRSDGASFIYARVMGEGPTEKWSSFLAPVPLD